MTDLSPHEIAADAINLLFEALESRPIVVSVNLDNTALDKIAGRLAQMSEEDQATMHEQLAKAGVDVRIGFPAPATSTVVITIAPDEEALATLQQLADLAFASMADDEDDDEDIDLDLTIDGDA